MTDEGIRQPTAAAAKRMAELLSEFEATPDAVRRIPRSFQIVGEPPIYLREHPAIKKFTRLAQVDGWMWPFDWGSWYEGREIASNPEQISNCDILTIRKLITALVRNERFCEGALQGAYKRGAINAILMRIQDLYRG